MEKPIDTVTVRKLLIYLRVNPGNLGYRYLSDAILYKLRRPAFVHSTFLYKKVAELHGVSTASAERCMRFAVQRAYDAGMAAALNALYKADVITAPPTLSDFIAYVTEYLDTFYCADDFLLS